MKVKEPASATDPVLPCDAGIRNNPGAGPLRESMRAGGVQFEWLIPPQ